MIENDDRIGQTIHERSMEAINEFRESNVEDLRWLTNETESFCRQRALNYALTRSAEIQDNAAKPEESQDGRLPGPGAIPELLQKALSVSFDTNVGHDWVEDYAERFKSYMEKAKKIPFSIDILNRITKGGVEYGTLNIILAGVNVGKSLTLCSLAADYITKGYDVLYISMEMSEEAVAKRIDANMIDVSMDDFDTLTAIEYEKKIKSQADKHKLGRLIIKRYPTSGAGAHHFRALLDELRTKKNWKPQIVMVDYLGICCSSRVKFSENSYHMVKSVAEELRGLAVEYNVAMWSAAQTTRGAWDSSDVNMSDTAESAGLPATADFMLAVVETEELAASQEYMFKQIKSRYGDKNINSKFNLSVSKGKQRVYETSGESAGPTNLEEASKASREQRAQNVFNSSRSKMDAFAGDGKDEGPPWEFD